MKGFGEKKFIQNDSHSFQPLINVLKYRELNVLCSQEPMKAPLLSFSAVDPSSSACRWRRRIKPLTARWTHEEWSIKYLIMWKTQWGVLCSVYNALQDLISDLKSELTGNFEKPGAGHDKGSCALRCLWTQGGHIGEISFFPLRSQENVQIPHILDALGNSLNISFPNASKLPCHLHRIGWNTWSDQSYMQCW